jgi:hypothetical protein
VITRMFRPKMDEVTGGCRKLHSDRLHSLYCSPDFIGMIKSRSMTQAGYVARMRGMRNAYKIVVGEPKRTRQF